MYLLVHCWYRNGNRSHWAASSLPLVTNVEAKSEVWGPPSPYWCVGLGWVGGDYGYWININIPICILTHWPALGTVLWPPNISLRTWLHIRKSYSREKKPSTVSCVQASSHRLEPPLQYFYQGCPGWSTPDYNIQVGTVFTLFHKNLGKEIKGDQSTW